MRTMGRKVPNRLIRPGNFAALCDVCDGRYFGSSLRRMEDGTLLCSGPGTLNCAKGRVGVTLDRLNAENAKRETPGVGSNHRTGRFDGPPYI
jgi:hypothetical protein